MASFLGLPGELRNRIYEFYAEAERARLHDEPTPKQKAQPKPKRGNKARNKRKKKAHDEAQTQNQMQLRLHRELKVFFPAIIRVNKQIRREYTSLIYSLDTLIIDKFSDYSIWYRFAETVGEDVLSQLQGLTISDLPRIVTCRTWAGSVDLDVSLIEMDDGEAVQCRWISYPALVDCYSCNQVTRDWHMRAAKKIREIIFNIEPKGGEDRRRITRDVLKRILGYATLDACIEDKAREERENQWGLEVVMIVLWLLIVFEIGFWGWKGFPVRIIAVALSWCWWKGEWADWFGDRARGVVRDGKRLLLGRREGAFVLAEE